MSTSLFGRNRIYYQYIGEEYKKDKSKLEVIISGREVISNMSMYIYLEYIKCILYYLFKSLDHSPL